MAQEEDSIPAQEAEPNESERVLLDRSQYAVIHDTDNEDDRSALECQLENALENGYLLIIIEPIGLGDQAIRWIRVGNFLHKSAVLLSIGGLVSAPFLSTRFLLYTSLPLGVAGVLCTCVYNLSWQFDPCCKYQVDYKGRELVKVPSHEIESRTPVVLVKKNDKYRRRLHNLIAFIVIGYFGRQLYRYFH